MLDYTEGLPGRTLDSVATDRRAGRFDGNGEPQPRHPKRVAAPEHRKQAVTHPDAALKYLFEFCGVPQPRVARQFVAAPRVTPRRYGQSRARPLRRRRLSTARPPLVAMRARNPWVRLRRKLLGW